MLRPPALPVGKPLSVVPGAGLGITFVPGAGPGITVVPKGAVFGGSVT